MDKDFNEFWDAYHPNEIRFPRRRAATFRAWNERTPAARRAMLELNGKTPTSSCRTFPNRNPSGKPAARQAKILCKSATTERTKFAHAPL